MIDKEIELMLGELKDDDKRMTVLNIAMRILANRILALLAPAKWDAESLIRIAIDEAESQLSESRVVREGLVQPDILWLTGLDQREREIIQNLVLRMLNYKTVVEQRNWLA